MDIKDAKAYRVEGTTGDGRPRLLRLFYAEDNYDESDELLVLIEKSVESYSIGVESDEVSENNKNAIPE